MNATWAEGLVIVLAILGSALLMFGQAIGLLMWAVVLGIVIGTLGRSPVVRSTRGPLRNDPDQTP